MSWSTPIRLHGGGTLVFDDSASSSSTSTSACIGHGQQRKLDELWAQGGFRADKTAQRAVVPGGYFADLHRQRAR